MCAECVRNVIFCVSYVDKNRAYAYVYASLWQTRCVRMHIYIKSIANAHVLRALLTYHNKRACVWLENRKRLPFFPLQLTFWFSENGTLLKIRKHAVCGAKKSPIHMCIACPEQSLCGRQETIQCAKHWLQTKLNASSMLSKSICALDHKKQKKPYTPCCCWKQINNGFNQICP